MKAMSTVKGIANYCFQMSSSMTGGVNYVQSGYVIATMIKCIIAARKQHKYNTVEEN